jgi:hypothetical protein
MKTFLRKTGFLNHKDTKTIKLKTVVLKTNIGKTGINRPNNEIEFLLYSTQKKNQLCIADNINY